MRWNGWNMIFIHLQIASWQSPEVAYALDNLVLWLNGVDDWNQKLFNRSSLNESTNMDICQDMC